MNLTATKTLCICAIAIAMMAPTAATANETSSVVGSAGEVASGFGTPEKLLEASRVWDLGEAKGGIQQLTAEVSAQQFENGYSVYVEGYEHAQAMSTAVYEHWALNSSIRIEERVELHGYPVETLTEEQAVSSRGEDLITGFARNAYEDVSYLQFVPSHDRVMDVSLPVRTGDSIGWDESLLVADIFALHSSARHLPGALGAAGYHAHPVMSINPGKVQALIGLGAYALPVGTPWVIYLAPGEQEAQHPEVTVRTYAAAAAELRKVYPHAQIVVGDVLTNGSDPLVEKLNYGLSAMAHKNGYGFTSTQSWAKRFGIKFEQVPYADASAAVSSEQLLFQMKWNIRRAIGE